MTAVVEIGGPPVGARWCRRSLAVRGPRAHRPAQEPRRRTHEAVRRALLDEVTAWDGDRVVHIWQDPDSELWHVAVTDGWGRRLAHVTPDGLPHDEARRVARRVWCHLRNLVAEAAA